MSVNVYLLCDSCMKRKWLCSHRMDEIRGTSVQLFALEHVTEGVRLVSEDESPRDAPLGYWAGDDWVLAQIDH